MASQSDIILCDVDGVIADCAGTVRKAIQDFVLVHGLTHGGKHLDHSHDVPELSEWHSWYFEVNAGLHPEDAARWHEYELSRDRLGWEVPLYPGAEEFVNELRKLGVVVFCTSQWSGMGCWVPARERLLQSHFPGTPVVFTHHKELVVGNYLIDDKPATIRHDHNKPRGLLFHQPWNSKESDLDDWRFDGYGAVLDALGADL